MQIHSNSNSSGALIGSLGAVIVSDTNVHEGPFYSIKALSECVVDTAIFEPSIEGSLDGLTILAGDTLMLFRITSVKLTSGSAILYKA